MLQMNRQKRQFFFFLKLPDSFNEIGQKVDIDPYEANKEVRNLLEKVSWFKKAQVKWRTRTSLFLVNSHSFSKLYVAFNFVATFPELPFPREKKNFPHLFYFLFWFVAAFVFSSKFKLLSRKASEIRALNHCLNYSVNFVS